MIWILGEYCINIEGVDKLFENFMINFLDEAVETQLALLTSVVKQYLKTDKGLNLLSKLLQMSTEEANNPDLRDRAYIYWRLISGDKELAKQIVLTDKPLINSEEKIINEKLREKLTKKIGHISSLLLQDPDTLIFNNE